MLISYKKLFKIIMGCLIATVLTVNTCYAINSQQNLKSDFSVPLLEGGVSITKSPRLITMSLRESDARQVLRMLADKAGMNIIMHDSVSGTVTLDLVNVTLNKAFEYVMVMNNLAYWVDGNTLIVASKDAAKDLAFAQQQIRSFDVKYENAGRIAEFLNKNIFKLKNPGLTNDEIAMSNPNTNQIMIIGTEKDFEIARKIISQFDKKTETVMFKVNHLSPGKMAGLVCHKVFKSADIKDESSDSDGKGGAKIACSSKDIEGSEVEGTFASFKSTGLVVTYYPDLGTIGVSGATKEQIDLVDEIIVQNDIKQPQAILEIAFIELSATGDRTFSPAWELVAGSFKLGFTSGALNIDFNANKKWPSEESQNNSTTSSSANSTLSGAAGIALDNGLRNRITIAMQQGKGRVLSNPKILVKNNVESTFDVTQEYISNIQSQFAQGGTYSQTIQSQTLETDDYGVKMTIKPTITPDGYIYMDLNPSYSTPTKEIKVGSTTGTETMQLVAERNLELKGIRLKDNETLIIGGLIMEVERKSSNKVPILGDIPVIGAAFRDSHKNLEKSELIIIVTPKIINDDEVIKERM